MNTRWTRKLATVAATGALALQLFAGTSLAAKPNASSSGASYDFAGGGWAGFSTTYDFKDNNIPRLYVELDVTGASSIGYVAFTKNGAPVSGCTISGLSVKCLYNTNVRKGDSLTLQVGAVPSQADVTAVAEWSTSGYVKGGNNSHGDAWDICNPAADTDCRTAGAGDAFGYAAGTIYLVASRGSDQGGNFAAGFGNVTLATNQAVDKKKNPQAAKLDKLPAGVASSVNDQAAYDSKTGFYTVEISVDNGKAHAFQLLIVYPKGTSAPKTYEHKSAGYTDATYSACAKNVTSNCFVWDSKTNTATLYLSHNGSIRRAG